MPDPTACPRSAPRRAAGATVRSRCRVGTDVAFDQSGLSGARFLAARVVARLEHHAAA